MAPKITYQNNLQIYMAFDKDMGRLELCYVIRLVYFI